MSKLPNAPLQEVIFELRWSIKNKEDLLKTQYLYGDLYSELKDIFPFRESLIPAEIPIDFLISQPVHRYRVSKDDYPLIQIGPGLLTLNTIDNKYFWEDFYKNAELLVDTFLINKINKEDLLKPSLMYYDFFKFDFLKNDVSKFINSNFNINYNQSFLNNLNKINNINVGFYYEIEEGNLSVNFQRGKNSKQEDGIVLLTKLNGNNTLPKKELILKWLDLSHEICSNIFKKITKEKFYNSFKKKI